MRSQVAGAYRWLANELATHRRGLVPHVALLDVVAAAGEGEDARDESDKGSLAQEGRCGEMWGDVGRCGEISA